MMASSCVCRGRPLVPRPTTIVPGRTPSRGVYAADSGAARTDARHRVDPTRESHFRAPFAPQHHRIADRQDSVPQPAWARRRGRRRERGVRPGTRESPVCLVAARDRESDQRHDDRGRDRDDVRPPHAARHGSTTSVSAASARSRTSPYARSCASSSDIVASQGRAQAAHPAVEMVRTVDTLQPSASAVSACVQPCAWTSSTAARCWFEELASARGSRGSMSGSFAAGTAGSTGRGAGSGGCATARPGTGTRPGSPSPRPRPSVSHADLERVGRRLASDLDPVERNQRPPQPRLDVRRRRNRSRGHRSLRPSPSACHRDRSPQETARRRAPRLAGASTSGYPAE